MDNWLQLFPKDIIESFELRNYGHAAEIMAQSYADELNEIILALRSLKISVNELVKAGGNESPIPPKFNAVLDPLGWKEIKITGDLVVKLYPRKGVKKSVFSETPQFHKTIPNYIDGHNIDFVKGRIALDVEWNSKDQTFDRDLFAMRTYYECDIISAGVIVTRSESLNQVFKDLNINGKYGASTTWTGKLYPRLDSRRHGGCPILVVGITPSSITDWGK